MSQAHATHVESWFISTCLSKRTRRSETTRRRRLHVHRGALFTAPALSLVIFKAEEALLHIPDSTGSLTCFSVLNPVSIKNSKCLSFELKSAMLQLSFQLSLRSNRSRIFPEQRKIKHKSVCVNI